jgi:hypothetical protein
MIPLLFFILCEEPVLLKNKLHLLFLLLKLILGSSSHILLLFSQHFQHLFSPKYLPFFLWCESVSLRLFKSFNVGSLLLFKRLLTLFLLSHDGFEEVALALGWAFGELFKVRDPFGLLFLQHPRVLVLKFDVFLLRLEFPIRLLFLRLLYVSENYLHSFQFIHFFLLPLFLLLLSFFF